MNLYQAEAADACRRSGVDLDLANAVISKESSGKTYAYRYEASVEEWFKSHPKAKGLIPARYAASYGLMQVLYATATDYGFSTEPEYLFVPRIGLEFGCLHLAAMIKWAHGDLSKALAAYNGGKGNADKAIPRAYAADVLSRRRRVISD